MRRPQPKAARKPSALQGESPVKPPKGAPVQEQSGGDAAKTKDGATKKKRQTTIYQSEADADRMRGAIMATMTTEGARSLSQFIAAAAMAEVERLEKKYNNGNPFPPVETGQFPTGRTFNH